ncbi:MAG: hypothetical protein M0Z46_10555 [Actinomycetota bacterium]|jgi:hypothetical protein|nr:hypothetical protein [Actinomycetota bacterium]
MSKPRVEGYDWDDFAGWFDQEWKPGEHVSIVTPTGGGKTTLAVGLMELRRWVGVIAPKGVDDTLRALHLRRLLNWPSDRAVTRLLDDDEEAGRPSRYVFGKDVETYDRDWPGLVGVYRDALAGMFRMRGWTCYVDDLKLLCDMGLGPAATRWLISARSRNLSFVSAFQFPRRVIRTALDEPSWIFASQTRDATVIDRTAEVLGRPKAEVRGMLEEIDRWTWLCVGRDPKAAVTVTMPPKRS